jgi:hypothetical protein
MTGKKKASVIVRSAKSQNGKKGSVIARIPNDEVDRETRQSANEELPGKNLTLQIAPQSGMSRCLGIPLYRRDSEKRNKKRTSLDSVRNDRKKTHLILAHYFLSSSILLLNSSSTHRLKGLIAPHLLILSQSQSLIISTALLLFTHRLVCSATFSRPLRKP